MGIDNLKKLDLGLTDAGNADRLVNRYGDCLRFCKSLGWLSWDGTRWRRDDLARVKHLAKKTAERLGVQQDIPRESVVSIGGYWQPKYSVPNKRMVAAVNLMAKTEGILLDPVYTGKAMAGLIGLSRQGYFKKGENVLFIHTGGAPGLYAYIRPVLGLEEVAD